MDFLYLKIAGGVMLAWIGYVIYKTVRAKISGDVTQDTVAEAAEVSIGDISDAANAALAKAQDFVAAEAKKVEEYLIQKTNIDAIIIKTNTDIDAAKAMVEKIKAIL